MMAAMTSRLLLAAMLAAAPAIASATASTIVFAISTSSAMPMTGFQNGILVDGLLKDFGDALAT